MADFLTTLAHTSCARASRDHTASEALLVADGYGLLCLHAFDPKSELHRQACMVLDLVIEKDVQLIWPHLDDFVLSLKNIIDESSIRVMSRICVSLSKLKLTDLQQQHITEACFDWLVGPHKVAAKSNAIYTLLILAQSDSWIATELQEIIQKDYSEGTAAYKAAAKKALRKLGKTRNIQALKTGNKK
jgi:hypothetical protein